MDDHTLQQVIDLAVKTAVLKAKKEAILECRPIGSYFITETEDDPNILFGGEWQKLTGRYVLQCSDANHKAGTTVEAGLPNINGSVLFRGADNGGLAMSVTTPENKGAFSVSGVNTIFNTTYPTTIKGSGQYLYIDASRSSSVYGKSDTVQPPARIVNVWKRVS